MSGSAFFQTRMGVRFYEGTMPKIAEQLERLNENLEALIDVLRNNHQHDPSAATAEGSVLVTDRN